MGMNRTAAGAGARSRILSFTVIAMLASSAGALAGQATVRVGDMAEARAFHSATLLEDGRVLVAGGETATAEIYDPATRSFAPVSGMAQKRRLHTATRLPDGKVLVAGGGESREAEIFDPATGAFTPTGSLITNQFGQTATLLRNGTVLIAGGIWWDQGAHRSYSAAAELYDPETGTFTPAGVYAATNTLYPDAGGPVWPTANVLPDGRVLFAGDNPPEIYDPSTATFTLAGTMVSARYRFGMYWHSATTLSDGSVLVAGGQDDWSCEGLQEAEIFDPVTATFRAVGTMMGGRDLHTATLLADGTVLLAGGGSGWCGQLSSESLELYLPATESFVRAGFLSQRRSAHTSTRLEDGSVLFVGGISYRPYEKLKSAELYIPNGSRPRQRSVRR